MVAQQNKLNSRTQSYMLAIFVTFHVSSVALFVAQKLYKYKKVF